VVTVITKIQKSKGPIKNVGHKQGILKGEVSLYH